MTADAGRSERGAGVHPIVGHLRPDIGPADRQRVDRLANRIVAADPAISANDVFGPNVEAGLSPGPTLHIHGLRQRYSSGLAYAREHRAFLLARDGDVVAMSHRPVEAFRDHCREDLGLGAPTILVPESSRRSKHLALRCRADNGAVGRLSELARSAGHLNVAPYEASGSVWAFAELIARTSGVAVHVAGPPPRLSRRVNDKVWFSEQVIELLGREAIPPTTSARSWAMLADRVRRCARENGSVGIKLPSASGAMGNLVIDSDLILGQPTLQGVVQELRRLLRHLGWENPFPILVSVWEAPVAATPSVQLWIPLEGDGDPIIEGVFDQRVGTKAGKFVGCSPTAMPRYHREWLAYEATLLGLLFQRLGYFGRCSFDSILVGDDIANAELHWIECNGRWGGTSIPMTLANRLAGDWITRPFVATGNVLGGSTATLAQVREAAADLIFDPARGTGLIFLSPTAAETGTGLDIMMMGESVEEADRAASEAIDFLSSVGDEHRSGRDPSSVAQPRSVSPMPS
ncbi:MAG: hypothetical protein ABFS34_14420 [Gemmatimonadota bacterium]